MLEVDDAVDTLLLFQWCHNIVDVVVVVPGCHACPRLFCRVASLSLREKLDTRNEIDVCLSECFGMIAGERPEGSNNSNSSTRSF